MVLKRRQLAEIERYFLYETEFAAELAERKANIADVSKPMDVTGVRSGSPGDSTGSAVVAIERDTQQLSAWLEVVA